MPGDPSCATRTSFDLSYRRLEPATQRVFRLLGHIPGPDFTPAAVAALAGVTVEAAGRALGRLVEAHLVAPRGPRLGLHDLVRDYAAEQRAGKPVPVGPAELRSDESDLAVERLFSWYLQLASAASHLLLPHTVVLPTPPPLDGVNAERFSDRDQALGWFEAELLCLMSAIRRAASSGPRQYAWLLADALRGFLWLGGRNSEWWESAETALAVAEAEGDLRGQAAAHASLASANHIRDRQELAIAHHTAALRLCRQAGWQEAEASTLSNLGLVYWTLGELDTAGQHLREALVLERRAAGRRSREATVLSRLGMTLYDLGRLREGAEHFAAALAIEREEGALAGQVTALANLGTAEIALGRPDAAVGHLEEGLAHARHIGLKGGESAILEGLASAQCDAGRHTDAREYTRAALVLARDIGFRRGEAAGRRPRRRGHAFVPAGT